MKKSTLGLAVLVVAALVYFAGYWPQSRQRSDAQARVQSLQVQLADAGARVRLAEVLGQLLILSDAVAARNYGDASTLSSAFFDRVRIELSRENRPDVTAALENILQTRDHITTAIVATDSALPMALKDHERTLRRLLGYPVDVSS